MQLTAALRLAPGMTVAFTGAGGKSAAVRRLVQELAPGSPVLVTTTTRLGKEQAALAAEHIVLSPGADLSGLRHELERHRSLLVTGKLLAEEGKWTAPPEQAQLQGLQQVAQAAGAVLLIEADGARGRSIKAPAEHEPVVPGFADLVVPVVGLDALGQPVDSPAVHRPERLAKLLGLPGEELLRAEHLAEALSSPRGGLKGIPAAAQVRVLLNKADHEDRLAAGRQIAERLLWLGSSDPTSRAEPGDLPDRPEHPIRAVALSSLDDHPAVHEMHGRVAGIVLAAGESSRLGVPKQLIRWRGRPLVWHAVQAARRAGLSPLVVVVGAAAAQVRSALEGEPISVLENPAWQSGQSSSVRLGLEQVRAQVEAAVFLLCDTPFVTPQLVGQLVQLHRRGLSPLVAPRAGGRRANPVLFDRQTFATLQQLTGDQGGRALFDRYPAAWVDWDDSLLLDVDSADDLKRLRDLE